MARLRRRRQKAEAISSTMPISTSSRGAEAWGSAPPFLEGLLLGPVLGLGLQQDWRPDEAELLAHLVDQIPLVRKMQRRTFVGEHGERRRTDGVLGDVVDLALFEVQVRHEAIEFARGDAPRSRVVHLANQLEQLAHPHALLGGEEHYLVVSHIPSS